MKVFSRPPPIPPPLQSQHAVSTSFSVNILTQTRTWTLHGRPLGARNNSTCICTPRCRNICWPRRPLMRTASVGSLLGWLLHAVPAQTQANGSILESSPPTLPSPAPRFPRPRPPPPCPPPNPPPSPPPDSPPFPPCHYSCVELLQLVNETCPIWLQPPSSPPSMPPTWPPPASPSLPALIEPDVPRLEFTARSPDPHDPVVGWLVLLSVLVALLSALSTALSYALLHQRWYGALTPSAAQGGHDDAHRAPPAIEFDSSFRAKLHQVDEVEELDPIEPPLTPQYSRQSSTRRHHQVDPQPHADAQPHAAPSTRAHIRRI